jgi:murein DD-endopeptidase MepM/ murein hydrolase activator NlpD
MVRATATGDHRAADDAYDMLQRTSGFELAIGRWRERRAVYAAPAFESRLIPGSRRDTHLGLDVFAPAGTGVYTPLDARVVASRNVQKPQDYGGVVLLEHEGPEGMRFRTLWGHLDPRSIAHLEPGMRLAAGDEFAHLGAADVNGGWVPHLHLQLVLTGEDDPVAIIGVGEWDLRELWCELYPDPLALAGVPAEVVSHDPPQTPAIAALSTSRKTSSFRTERPSTSSVVAMSGCSTAVGARTSTATTTSPMSVTLIRRLFARSQNRRRSSIPTRGTSTS